MDLADVTRALKHHKVLVGTLISLTIVAAAFVFVHVPQRFKTTAALVVLSPTKPVVPGAKSADEAVQTVNPFLSFGGSQETAAQVLQLRMSDDAVGHQLEDVGVRGVWTFEIKGGSGPLISVTATEATADAARASADHILATAADQFASLQREAGSPPDQMIRVSVVNTPAPPEPVYDDKIRTTALVAMLGLLATIAIPLAVEGASRARAARRADGTDGDGQDGGDLEAIDETPDGTEPADERADGADDADADADEVDEPQPARPTLAGLPVWAGAPVGGSVGGERGRSPATVGRSTP